MKGAVRDVKAINAIILLFLSIFLVEKLSHYVFSVDGYAFEFEDACSQLHKSEIITFINENKAFKRLSLKSIARKMKEQFPSIQSVQSFYSSSSILRFRIALCKPAVLVNDSYVISENKILLDKTIFSENKVKDCPAIEIKNIQRSDEDSLCLSKKITEKCKKMIFDLPAECFNEYDIVRESETKSVMCHKKQGNFSVWFNDSKVPDNKVLIVCGLLKNKLTEQGEFSRRYPRRWIADVRFDDQVILYMERGGR